MAIEARLISNEGVIVAVLAIPDLRSFLDRAHMRPLNLEDAWEDAHSAPFSYTRYFLEIAFKAEDSEDLIAVYREERL